MKKSAKKTPTKKQKDHQKGQKSHSKSKSPAKKLVKNTKGKNLKAAKRAMPAATIKEKVPSKSSPSSEIRLEKAFKVEVRATDKNSKYSKYSAPGIGDLVPNFVLPSTEGEFCLNDFRGKKVILYFYPKDSTPGCTIEGKEFSDQIEQFRSKGVEVFGVSRDNLKSHQNFKTKQGFKFSLLSDEEEKACQIFDVIKEKNMYGKIVLGIERSTFLIGEDGKLLAEWRKVKAQGHASEVFAEI